MARLGAMRAPVERRPRPRAAEQPARYGVDEDAGGVARLATRRRRRGRGPRLDELIALRRRLELGVRQLACGRRAPGERTLRQAIAALARRDDRRHAAVGAIALAGVARAARARAARRSTCWPTGDSPDRDAGETGLLVDAATLAAVAWTDLGRLDEAESASGSAIGAARARGRHAAPGRRDPGARRAVCSGAAGMPTPSGRSGRSPARRSRRVRPPPSTRSPRASASVCGDAGRGVAGPPGRVEQAECASDERLLAHARCSAAFAHLAVGDLDAVERRRRRRSARRARGARSAARAARCGCCSPNARAVRADRRRPRGLLPRPGHGRDAALPPVVRARCGAHPRPRPLVEAAARSREPPRHVDGPGGARALRARRPALGAGSRSRAPGRMIEILGLCQHARDEDAVLAEVCERLRRQLRAAGVGFFACEAGRLAAVVARGGRVEPAIAGRAIAAGVPVAPASLRGSRSKAPFPFATRARPSARSRRDGRSGRRRPGRGAGRARRSPPRRRRPMLSALLARRSRPPADAVHGLAGTSQAIDDVRRAAERAAAAPFPVLIEGESGSGKELVARAVHRLRTAAGPAVLHAELRGHPRRSRRGRAVRPRARRVHRRGRRASRRVRGGATAARCSSTRSASCRRAAQAKLLRVVQEGELRRVGENTPRRVDVRIVAATNRDLRAEAAAGRFRLDLLYRLDVLRIVVPPLRERGEDVAVLAEAVLARGDSAARQPRDARRGDARRARALRLARQRARAAERARGARRADAEARRRPAERAAAALRGRASGPRAGGSTTRGGRSRSGSSAPRSFEPAATAPGPPRNWESRGRG